MSPTNATTIIKHGDYPVNSGAVFYPGDELICVDPEANPDPNITWTWNTKKHSGNPFIIVNDMIDQAYILSCEARNIINGEIHAGYAFVSISVEGNVIFVRTFNCLIVICFIGLAA